MQLARYLARIGLDDKLAPTRDGLARLQRAHALHVPFENLDVQLGVPIDTDIGAAYDKIVERRRGGWCYEHNGLFGWALEAQGFHVTRIAAAVMRHERGSVADANHLCLLVRTQDADDDVILADVGFGGSLIAPLVLREDSQEQAPFRVGLRRVGGAWRFFQDAGKGAFSYDFCADVASEQALAAKCRELQSNPESNFVQNLVAQKRHATAHVTLRGRVLARLDETGLTEHRLATAAELVETLSREFGLDLPEAGQLWPRVLARHEALFPDD